jgi:hypothetical protein
MQDMTVNELLKAVELMKSVETSFWVPGKNYFIRTVTMHNVGKLVTIDDKEIHLTQASWIADSGRFHDALKSGQFDEIEPFVEDIIINRSAIIDATIFNHDLPKVQK